MHGVVNKAIEAFVTDSYGNDTWERVTQFAHLDHVTFEALLTYDDVIASALIEASVEVLGKPRETILEDLGLYLVAHPNCQSIRRLLRFGGTRFSDFLHSLDDLPERARLAVPDLELGVFKLSERSPGQLNLRIESPIPDFGHVVTGLLYGMADDYGALAMIDHKGHAEAGVECLEITVHAADFSQGNAFELGTAGATQ